MQKYGTKDYNKNVARIQYTRVKTIFLKKNAILLFPWPQLKYRAKKIAWYCVNKNFKISLTAGTEIIYIISENKHWCLNVSV